MSLTVNQTCERLNNRLDTPLLFEGRRVKLRPNDSVCRQLYQLWRRRSHQVRDYPSFKQSLRFQLARDVTRVTMARDLRPWVAGGLTAAGLGAASAWYLTSRDTPTMKSTATGGRGNAGTTRNQPQQPQQKFEAYPYDDLKCGPERNENDSGKPAVFQHWNNSCYFHSAMLILYQMKDWFLETQPNADSSEYVNAAPLLADLKFLITRMSKQDVIPVKCFSTIYTRAHQIVFPTHSKGCQEDTDSFLNGVFNRVADISEIVVAKNTWECVSKELIPLYYDGQKVPEAVTLPFSQTADRNDKGEIIFGNYSYEGTEIVKKKGKRWEFMKTDLISQEAIPDNELTLSAFTAEPWTRLKVLPGEDFFYNIQVRLESEKVWYTRCENPDYYPGLMVRCRRTRKFEPSKYLIVHVHYGLPKDFKTTLKETNIKLKGRAYTLIGATFRDGSTGGSGGHYTAAIAIEDQWWYYDDLGPTRYNIESLSQITLWPQTLLFRRVDQEPKQ